MTKHAQSPEHMRAFLMQTYRHRDDTDHSADGPLGCWICAELRRAERENAERA